MRIPRFSVLFLLGLSIGFAQSARVLTRGEIKQVIINQPYSPHIPVPPPIWSGHALLVLIVNETREPVLNVVTADGLTEEVRFKMADWPHIRVNSLWGGDDGEIVAAGTGTTEKSEPGSFVVRIGADRAQRTYIPVENLNIQAMTVGPSGVIWAIGVGKDKETDGVRAILERLSPTGKVLTAIMLSLPISDLSPSQMRASADRVAWLTGRNEYFEFSTDGSVMTRVPGPGASDFSSLHSAALATSAANTTLISKPFHSKDYKTQRLDVWMLDRVKQAWIASEAAEGVFPVATKIYGFDGDTLMTSGFDKQLGPLLVRYALSETKPSN